MSRGGQTLEAKKVYGSVNGVSKLIFSSGGLAPFDPSNPDWDSLGNWVKAGRANEVVSVGDVIDVAYKISNLNLTMPMRVMGFYDAELQNGTKVPAIYFHSMYADDWTSVVGTDYGYPALYWSAAPYYSDKYKGSFLEAVYRLDYQNRFDDSFTENVSPVKIISAGYYPRFQLDQVVYDKFWCPSGFNYLQKPNIADSSLISALGGTIQPCFFKANETAFRNFANDIKGRLIDPTDTSSPVQVNTGFTYWLRDFYRNSSTPCCVYRSNYGEKPLMDRYPSQVCPIVGLCAFTGKY